jgi:hypothetical protein
MISKCLAMIGWSKMNERFPDLTPHGMLLGGCALTPHGMLLGGCVLPKKINKKDTTNI